MREAERWAESRSVKSGWKSGGTPSGGSEKPQRKPSSRSNRREAFIRRRWKVSPARQIKNVQLDGERGGKMAFICYNVTDVQK